MKRWHHAGAASLALGALIVTTPVAAFDRDTDIVGVGAHYAFISPGPVVLEQDTGVRRMTLDSPGSLHGFDLGAHMGFGYLELDFTTGASFGSTTPTAVQIDSSYEGTAFASGRRPDVRLSAFRLRFSIGPRYSFGPIAFALGAGLGYDLWTALPTGDNVKKTGSAVSAVEKTSQGQLLLPLAMPIELRPTQSVAFLLVPSYLIGLGSLGGHYFGMNVGIVFDLMSLARSGGSGAGGSSGYVPPPSPPVTSSSGCSAMTPVDCGGWCCSEGWSCASGGQCAKNAGAEPPPPPPPPPASTGGSCASGSYACSDGGCCPFGTTCAPGFKCQGATPPPTSTCPSGSYHCSDGGCCPSGTVCAPGWKCK